VANTKVNGGFPSLGSSMFSKSPSKMLHQTSTTSSTISSKVATEGGDPIPERWIFV
jgi:hypothetical protein